MHSFGLSGVAFIAVFSQNRPNSPFKKIEPLIGSHHGRQHEQKKRGCGKTDIHSAGNSSWVQVRTRRGDTSCLGTSADFTVFFCGLRSIVSSILQFVGRGSQIVQQLECTVLRPWKSQKLPVAFGFSPPGRRAKVMDFNLRSLPLAAKFSVRLVSDCSPEICSSDSTDYRSRENRAAPGGGCWRAKKDSGRIKKEWGK